ncbi:hypothetical protein CC86DRAFT_294680 [Ophiobolus disseminans]|uniref:Uncharacterized protein n=1 Tax=Ophiobolus disseminans TaxID=1469910 RepID=A0A6A6ZVY4_9PLEO|nr:hypothetical protein CC86DRAFT_294680 [Ophiobolus disseminans]
MARLKKTPRRGLTIDLSSPPWSDLSSPPSSSHTSIDAEAATQQLHAEDRASTSRTPNPPKPSAILGANLLNAALIDFRHSSPFRAHRRSSDGKLPKVGLFTEPTRKNLARPRGDTWAFPTESPEKTAFRLPERVNQVPLKILKKKKAQQAVHSDAVAPSSDLSETNLPSSPPRIAWGSNSPTDDHDEGSSVSDPNRVQIEEQFPDGTTRCTAVAYKNTLPAGPRYEQCHRAGTADTDHGLQCTRHAQKPGSVRCDYISDYTGVAIQCRGAGRNGTSRCAIHKTKSQEPEVNEEETHDGITSRSSAKRKSQDGDSDSIRPTKSTRREKLASSNPEPEVEVRPRPLTHSKPQVQIPVRKGKKVDSITTETRKDWPEAVTQSIENTAPTQSTSGRRTRSKKGQVAKTTGNSSQSKPQRPGKLTRVSNGGASTQSKGSDVPRAGQGEEPEEDVDEAGDEQEPRTAKQPSGTIEHVFEFLELEERDGSCQTKLGTTIKRVCEMSASHLQNIDVTTDEAVDNIKDVREVLKEVGKIGDKNHRALKEDMYGYVFRSAALVLQSLYEYLKELDDDAMHSLDALRIITPFIHDILAVKDIVAGWKVKALQRYQGDRMIMDLDSYLIVPLREVEKTFSRRLSQLENRESLRRQAARMRREAEREAERQVRQTEMHTVSDERWKRWQELHVTRMQCEPFGSRRSNLSIGKREDFDERDADGFRFERVPAFRDRSSPPPIQMTQDADWSDEQVIALIEGLESFSGRNVFHNIFRAHCRPDGLLRDFSVAQIVNKAMWIRREIKRLREATREEVPVWIEQVPRFP